MERIVSLLPSLTEIVCALGLREQLVGRSHECDHPAGVDVLPALTEPKLDPGRSSAEIDSRVRQLVAEGLSVYRVDAERLRDLAPTTILTQDQCEVCAASLGDVEQALEEWNGARPRVVSLAPTTLGDVWDDILRVGEALGVEGRARALCERLSDSVTDLAERALRIREQPKVACIEWLDPLMAAGNWVPELVTLAGGRCAFCQPGEHSPSLEWSALSDADPDVVVLMPCGFDMDRIREEAAALERSGAKLASLRAAREGRLVVVDGNQYFNRPGPRLLDSLEILAEIQHPDHFPPLHRGTGWEHLDLA